MGVVKDASFLTRDSLQQLYLPYTTVAGYDKDSKDAGMLGPYTVYFKVKDDAMGAALEAAMHEMVRKYNTSQKRINWFYQVRMFIGKVSIGVEMFLWTGGS